MEYKNKNSRFRPSGALLSMTALATIWSASPAAANCDITSSPNSVSCTADTVTVHNTNTLLGSYRQDALRMELFLRLRAWETAHRTSGVRVEILG